MQKCLLTGDNVYAGFYNVFEEAVLDAVCPNMVFSLSGGLDTRVIAGILAKNGVDLPVISWGNKIENSVAGKVAKCLGLKHHYFCSAHDLHGKLKSNGLKHVLSALFFDEVNGSWVGARAKSNREFVEAVFTSVKNKERAFQKDVLEYLHTYMIPWEYWVTPVLDPRVLSFLDGMPYQLRIRKGCQTWILRNKFPRLARIICYDSFLLVRLPYLLHGFATMLHYPRNLRNIVKRRLCNS